MPSKGRPLKTEIRDKISSILARVNQSYGYEIYKIYQQIFGKITLRNLYYNLKKGIALGEFIIVDIRQELGSFTWGGASQHIYYALGPYAHIFPTTHQQKEKLETLPQKELKIDWDKEVDKKIEEMECSVQNYLKEESRMLYEDKTKFKLKIKNQANLLKEWIAGKFERQKAHELRLRIDSLVDKFK